MQDHTSVLHPKQGVQRDSVPQGGVAHGLAGSPA